MKINFIIILATLTIFGFVILTCTETPTNPPERDNPLDANNPETGGDPFYLYACIGGGGIQLTWTAVPEVASVVSYDIYRKVDNAGFPAAPYHQINGDNINFWTDTGVQNGHKYTYYITARDNQGLESNSNTAQVEVNSTPVLAINDQSGVTPTRQVGLTLLAYGAQKMQIGTPDLTGAAWVNYATTSSIQLTTGAGTKTVKARFIYPNADTSAIVSDNTQPMTMNPSFNINNNAPETDLTNVTLYLSAQGSNLKYMASENSGFGGASWLSYNSQVNFSLTTGIGGKTVYVKYKNDFEIESSVLSNTISYVYCSAPTNLTASANETVITLTWQDNSAMEQGYKIERKAGTSGTYTQIGTTNTNVVTFTDNTGVPGTTYYYRVRAYNSQGNSNYSNGSNVTCQFNAPTNLTASANETVITLTWQDHSNVEQGCNIERKTGTSGTYAQIGTTNTNVVTFTDNTGVPGTTYYYRVCAYNSQGNSSYSNESSAACSFNAPTNLTSSANETVITLTWQDHSNVEQGFKIERKAGSSGTYSQIGTTNANVVSYMDNTGIPGTTYYYQVRAYNSQGNSNYSNESNVTCQINAPTNLTCTLISLSQIDLSWQDNSNIEQGYKVERKTGAGGSWSVIYTTGANAESYANTGLAQNTVYFYRVQGYNGSIYSGYSNEAVDTTTYSAGYTQSFPLGNTGLNIQMVWIPPGSFIQGSNMAAYPWEKPMHSVSINYGFWLGKYEVTQAQWETIAGSWSFYFDGYPNRPSEQVSWDDITNTFLPGLNSQSTAGTWRLPSESEWEYACRAGTTTAYYWGDWGNEDLYCWYDGNSNNQTHEVGLKIPNAWNLYDMSGNVNEWCEDYWHNDYTGAPTNGSAWLIPSGTSRVARSGDWDELEGYNRSAYRSGFWPWSSDYTIGFRLVLSP